MHQAGPHSIVDRRLLGKGIRGDRLRRIQRGEQRVQKRLLILLRRQGVIRVDNGDELIELHHIGAYKHLALSGKAAVLRCCGNHRITGRNRRNAAAFYRCDRRIGRFPDHNLVIGLAGRYRSGQLCGRTVWERQLRAVERDTGHATAAFLKVTVQVASTPDYRRM